MNLIDLKERIALATWSERPSDAERCCFTAAERDYLLDAINRADNKSKWTCGHVAGAHCAECYRLLAVRANELAAQAMRLIAEVEDLKRAPRE